MPYYLIESYNHMNAFDDDIDALSLACWRQSEDKWCGSFSFGGDPGESDSSDDGSCGSWSDSDGEFCGSVYLDEGIVNIPRVCDLVFLVGFFLQV